MNILERTKDFYDKAGGNMFADISAYSANGYVFITPTTLLLGKAVRTDLDTHPTINGIHLVRMHGMCVQQ